MDLHSDLRHCEIFLQRIIEGDPPSLANGEDFETMYLGDLLGGWHHTGEYLYPRMSQPINVTGLGAFPIGSTVDITNSRGEHEYFSVTGHAENTSQIIHLDQQIATQAPPLVGEWYRWESGDVPITLFFVEGIANGQVEVSLGMTDTLEHIPVEDFIRALANGPRDEPRGEASAQHLNYEWVFSEPYLDDTDESGFLPGSVMLDTEGREFFLLARNRNNTWVCRAAHDMSTCPENYLARAHFLASQFRAQFHMEAVEVMSGTPEGIGMSFAERVLQLNQPMGSAYLAGEPIHEDDPDYFRPVNGDISGNPEPPMRFRIGDRWHFDAPNEGIWTLETVEDRYHEGEHTITNRFRGDDGAVMSGPQDWVIRNGRRITPPDPRFTGDPVEPNQVWEIPTNTTRQPTSRWKVTSLATRSTGDEMVNLTPENGKGAPICWPVIRLRAQGRCVFDGRIRRTSFERLISDEGDDVG
jgi:hypothetical protein